MLTWLRQRGKRRKAERGDAREPASSRTESVKGSAPRSEPSQSDSLRGDPGAPDPQQLEARARAMQQWQAAMARARSIQARYDAAQTTHENRRHWANADLLSADAAASPDIRRVLRSRARYEVANNSYAKGIVQTQANYVVGTGPRLQTLLSSTNANRLVLRE